MKDFDVHFQLNGYTRVEALTEEDARDAVNKFIHATAQRIEKDYLLNVVDSDEESYVTDVLGDDD